MRYFCSVIITALGLLSFTAQAQFLNKHIRIMPLGDSITYGTSYAGSYRVELEKLLRGAGVDVEFVGSQKNGPPELRSQYNEGHGGWKIANIANNVVSWVAQYRPQVILLLIGTNDLWVRPENPDPDPFRALVRMQDLISLILTTFPDVKLVVGSVPYADTLWISNVMLFNNGLFPLLTSQPEWQSRLFFVDIYTKLGPGMFVDGIHPTREGYSPIAQAWFNLLNQNNYFQ